MLSECSLVFPLPLATSRPYVPLSIPCDFSIRFSDGFCHNPPTRTFSRKGAFYVNYICKNKKFFLKKSMIFVYIGINRIPNDEDYFLFCRGSTSTRISLMSYCFILFFCFIKYNFVFESTDMCYHIQPHIL